MQKSFFAGVAVTLVCLNAMLAAANDPNLAVEDLAAKIDRTLPDQSERDIRAWLDARIEESGDFGLYSFGWTCLRIKGDVAQADLNRGAFADAAAQETEPHTIHNGQKEYPMNRPRSLVLQLAAPALVAALGIAALPAAGAEDASPAAANRPDNSANPATDDLLEMDVFTRTAEGYHFLLDGGAVGVLWERGQAPDVPGGTVPETVRFTRIPAEAIASLAKRAELPAAPVQEPTLPDRIFDIRDFGAKGDRQTRDTQAIQAAVDAANKAGGGTAFVPPGDYLAGTIWLRDKVALRLAEGATLLASTDPEDYPQTRRLLAAKDAQQISVVGPGGAIAGQATGDYGGRWGVPEKPAFRTGILEFDNCRDIQIRQVTIRHSDSWTLHFKRCERIIIDRVTIRNNYRRLNSDGIDPNSCRQVRITNCDIVAGDDCIVLKTTEPHPCEDVIVKNCILESAASALKLGTESKGDFRDIRFSNCTIRNSPTGIGLYLKDGATMERITFENVTVETPKEKSFRDVTPLFVDIEKRHADSPVGKIRELVFRDLELRGGTGALLQGMPESPLENVTLENITFHADWADDYANRKKPVGGRRTTRDERDTRYARLPSWMTIAHARNVTVANLRVVVAPEVAQQFPRAALSLSFVEDGHLSRIARSPAEPRDPPVIKLEDCRDVMTAEKLN